MKQCQICSVDFTQLCAWQKYCSPKCRAESCRLLVLKKYVYKGDSGWRKHKRKCKPCGKSFLPQSHNQKYCCVKCSRESQSFDYIQKHIKELPDTKTYKWLKARVLVFDRDRFTCQYCGRTPTRDGVVLHVDHKIPLNEGGSYELENLITACAECNLGKSDLMIEQWAKEKAT